MQHKSLILFILIIILHISAGCTIVKTNYYKLKESMAKANAEAADETDTDIDIDENVDIDTETGAGIDTNVVRAKSLSFLQVKEKILSSGIEFNSLKAKLKISIKSPDINGPFKCDGIMRLQKPNQIRVIGSKLARTVFDMLSDGKNYWCYLPKQKLVYTGQSHSERTGNEKIYVHPDDIAVFLNYDKLFEGRSSFMETWPAYWFIHVFEEKGKEFTPYGRLKIDRIENRVTELTLFNTNSLIKAQAFFEEYTTVDGRQVPKTVQIDWPETKTTIILGLNDISLDEHLKPQMFQFKRPKNAEIIRVN